jgi:hypothetical protein
MYKTKYLLQASAIYIENISRKSEDREQFNSVQENCDEVVQIESENQELVVESPINFLLIY